MRNSLALAAFLAVGASAAPMNTKDPGAHDPQDKALIVAQQPEYLKLYPLASYKEYWTMTFNVGRLDRDLPKVLKAMEKVNASLTEPFKNFPASATNKTQQLSYKMSLRSGKAALVELKKLGEFSGPLVRPTMESISLPEVKAKIDKLMAERTQHAKELAQMPAISTLTDELLAHLLLVENVQEKADAEVLLNMTVQERR